MSAHASKTPATAARLALVVVLIALVVTACGRRGGLTPPEGDEANYVWPRTYPPAGTTPVITDDSPAELDRPGQSILEPDDDRTSTEVIGE